MTTKRRHGRRNGKRRSRKSTKPASIHARLKPASSRRELQRVLSRDRRKPKPASARRKNFLQRVSSRARRKLKPVRGRNFLRSASAVARNHDNVAPIRKVVENLDRSKTNATIAAEREKRRSVQNTDALDEFRANKFLSEYVDGFEGSPPERNPPSPPSPPSSPSPQPRPPRNPLLIPMNPALVAMTLLANMWLLAQQVSQIESLKAALEMKHVEAFGIAAVAVVSVCLACELIKWMRNFWK
jgi:hypothetical protein